MMPPVYLTNVGEVKVKHVECQGNGNALYCNNGAIYENGKVRFETWVASSEPLTDEQIKRLKEAKGGEA